MMKTLKIIITLFLLLLIWPYDVYAQGGAQPKSKELFAESGQVNVKVLVSHWPESKSCIGTYSWLGWGVVENSCPDTIIDALKIKISGEPVPESLIWGFFDLANPRTVRIESRKGKGRFAVVLFGGDTHTSYSATLEFENNLLSERMVHAGEFPNEIWEKTLYKVRAELGVSNERNLFVESGQGQVSVRAVVTSLPKSQPCKTAASWEWGAINSCPDTVISALEIKISGEPVFVPLSAFADLGNPRTVRIESRKGKGRFAVVLVGGDAATSYAVTLKFRNSLLKERSVRHGEFPDESWEKTSYKFNIGN